MRFHLRRLSRFSGITVGSEIFHLVGFQRAGRSDASGAEIIFVSKRLVQMPGNHLDIGHIKKCLIQCHILVMEDGFLSWEFCIIDIMMMDYC